MNIKGYVLHKSNEFLDCELVIIGSKLKEISIGDFKNIYPELYRSERSNIVEIKKFHEPKIIQNNCKYYIQSSVDGKLTNIFLDINVLQYMRLKWNLKKYLIQSREVHIDLIKYISVTIIGFVLGFLFQKQNEDNQAPNSADNTHKTASKIAKDSVIMKENLLSK